MSEDPNNYRIPKRINEPSTLIFWPLPRVLPFFICMGMGYAMNSILPFTILGIVWFYLYGYIETNFEKGYLGQFAWRHGFTAGIVKESKTVPDPMKREFIQ